MDLFSTELKQRRTKMKLSQREAAKRCGISYNMLHRYEKGIRLMEMSAEKASVLADFFRWNLKDMMKKMRAEAKGKK